MSITQQELARRLREAREANGLTQEEVAGHLKLSRPSVAQIELGNRAVSSLELDRLALLYGRDIRHFLAPEFRPEDSVVALFRATAGAGAQEEVLAAVRGCAALAQAVAGLEELLGLDRSQVGVPAYPAAPPKTKWQAVEQGIRAATDERRRLGFGEGPVGDVMDLLEGQGVRTATVDLPEDVSGLTLMQPGLSLLVVANRRHPFLRRRFSWVHEYAHVLLDRSRRGALSQSSNREELSEIRANAFAAAFLMPEEGVRDFLAGLGKGQPTRERLEVFDGKDSVFAEVRSESSTQKIQLYDVVLLADHFGVSRTAVLFRLRSLQLLSQEGLDVLRAEEEAGRGRSLARSLGLPEPDHAAARDEFRSRFLGMALEAFRREKITRGKLRELMKQVGASPRDMDRLLEEAGLDDQSEALLPEGLD
jgi:Zn-dependent peptidase ImmA (M78 family)/transcriptional regulator with XRE-family HTH domain